MSSFIDINFVLPAVLKVGAEGFISVQPIPGVDQTTAIIYDMTLDIPGGASHAVVQYQRDFASADWTFSFFVPQSFLNEPGPAALATIKFKISDKGKIFQTQDDFIIWVGIDTNKSPFSVTSITPTSVELDAQSTAQLLLAGTGFDKTFSNCNLVGPSPVYATITGASATNCTVDIKGSDVSVFGAYRILLCVDEEDTPDTFIAPTFIHIEKKIPLPNLTLLSMDPDILWQGNNFALEISKDDATCGWNDVRIGDIKINAASGYTMDVSHKGIIRISNTECRVRCTLSSLPKIQVREAATLKLSATNKGKPINVTNTLPLTLRPIPPASTFRISGCLPFTVAKTTITGTNFRFYLTGTDLDQIIAIHFGTSYQLGIFTRTPFSMQCKFFVPPRTIQPGPYQFTVRYKDPNSGIEQTKVVQNIQVTVILP
ncbi:hypothetical protein [Verminephrobacter aporrectodeae]|uniref:hypothetical protein n=1 Tax=Verminephrobacter aporrectodeae TaxID=1110389 RepID=UPI002243B708|nr:hypothetical protein [Verminephrobacter aporrectodeae]